VAEAETGAAKEYSGCCHRVRSEEKRNGCGAAPVWRRLVCVGLGGEDDKDCGGWIIVTGFRVLLISQHLFPEILLEAVLGIHAGSVKIKSICIQML